MSSSTSSPPLPLSVSPDSVHSSTTSPAPPPAPQAPRTLQFGNNHRSTPPPPPSTSPATPKSNSSYRSRFPSIPPVNANSSNSLSPSTPSSIPSIIPSIRSHHAGEGEPAPWNLRDGFVIPTLSHSLTLSAHLAAHAVDDRIISFRFVTSSDAEVTLHRSRLFFVSGPLSVLVNRPFTDLNEGYITLSPKDKPQAFRHIRHFLYGLPLDLTKITLPQVIDLALTANRWQLDDLFHPVCIHISRNKLPDPVSLQSSAQLLTIDNTNERLRTHVREQLAIYLSHSLQTTFPNAPTAASTALLQTYHDVNDLATTLTLASRQAPFLPLLHGVIASLETRLDDYRLGTYIKALPVSSAGVSRLLSCDAATARWPARAVRIAASIATAATEDVSRAALSLRVGAPSSVVISGASFSLSAVRDANGMGVSVDLGDGSDTSLCNNWRFSRISIRGAECSCSRGGVINGGGDVILEPENDKVSRSGVVRFHGEDIDLWIKDHGTCGEMSLAVEVELLKGRAAVFVQGRDSVIGDDLNRGSNMKSPDIPSSKGDIDGQDVNEGPALTSRTDGRRNSGDTTGPTPLSGDRGGRSGHSSAVWYL